MIQIAESLKVDFSKGAALEKIALILANQGDFNNAILVAENISFPKSKCDALRGIALVLVALGEIGKSIQIIECIKYDFEKSLAFKEIAVMLATQGKLSDYSFMLDKSVQIAEGITDKFDKICAFEMLAVVFENQGNLIEYSRLIVKSIMEYKGISSHYKSDIIKSVAILLASQGHKTKPILLTQEIKSDNFTDIDKQSALGEISVQLAKNGNFDNSITIAEGITYDNWKSYTFCEIAFAFANQGRLNEFYYTLEKTIIITEGISVVYLKNSALAKISIMLAKIGDINKSIKIAEGITDNNRNKAFQEISIVLANQGEIEKSIQKAEGINDDNDKISVFLEIAVVLANQGKSTESTMILEKSIQTADGIYDNNDKISAFLKIAVVLANQGNSTESGMILVKSILTAEGIKRDSAKSSAFKEIAVLLANQGKLSESIHVMQKINRGYDRMEGWVAIGKEFYKRNQLQSLHQILSQLPNDEAVIFFKKGIAQSITATNANEETVLQILPFLKEDKESVEHLMQMHALYCTFFENASKEKIAKFNRTLNIQWALDITAKFEQEEIKTAINVDAWIEDIADEDDREDVRSWAEKVKAGSMTEERFEERLKKLIT